MWQALSEETLLDGRCLQVLRSTANPAATAYRSCQVNACMDEALSSIWSCFDDWESRRRNICTTAATGAWKSFRGCPESAARQITPDKLAVSIIWQVGCASSPPTPLVPNPNQGELATRFQKTKSWNDWYERVRNLWLTWQGAFDAQNQAHAAAVAAAIAAGIPVPAPPVPPPQPVMPPAANEW